MSKAEVNTPGQALAYLVDCTLATISHMAMLKLRKKSEYERQIAIAQNGVDWMVQMNIDPSTTRAAEIISQGLTVADWAKGFTLGEP
jgi:hypothetical protein